MIAKGLAYDCKTGITSEIEYEVVEPTAEEIAAQQAEMERAEALIRLSQLDLKVPRGLEDLVAANNLTVPTITQLIISEKVELRGKL